MLQAHQKPSNFLTGLSFNQELPCQELKAFPCQATVSRLDRVKLTCQEYKAFPCQAGRRIQANKVTWYHLFCGRIAHITVFNTLSVSCERVVRVSSPKWLKSCAEVTGSIFYVRFCSMKQSNSEDLILYVLKAIAS